MRLGFNWAMGPFEMLRSIGVNKFFERIDGFENNKFLENLSKTKMKISMEKDSSIQIFKL